MTDYVGDFPTRGVDLAAGIPGPPALASAARTPVAR